MAASFHVCVQSAREGRALLLTTHYMDEADLLSNQVIIMAGGQLCSSGTPLQLKARWAAKTVHVCLVGSCRAARTIHACLVGGREERVCVLVMLHPCSFVTPSPSLRHRQGYMPP